MVCVTDLTMLTSLFCVCICFVCIVCFARFARFARVCNQLGQLGKLFVNWHSGVVVVVGVSGVVCAHYVLAKLECAVCAHCQAALFFVADHAGKLHTRLAQLGQQFRRVHQRDASLGLHCQLVSLVQPLVPLGILVRKVVQLETR